MKMTSPVVGVAVAVAVVGGAETQDMATDSTAEAALEDTVVLDPRDHLCLQDPQDPQDPPAPQATVVDRLRRIRKHLLLHQ